MADRKTRADRVYFSVEEANELVPRLSAHFDVIGARIARIREIHHHLASLGGAHPGPLRTELLALHAALAAEVEAVEALGAVVKDVEKGLVDFWHRHGTQDVQLCWRHGESAIEWYHGADEGFAGRKPVAALAASERTPPRSSSLH